MCRHYFKYRNQINKYRDLTLIWAHYQGRKCESQHSLYYSYYYSIEIYNMLIFVDHQFCPIAMCVSSPPPQSFLSTIYQGCSSLVYTMGFPVLVNNFIPIIANPEPNFASSLNHVSKKSIVMLLKEVHVNTSLSTCSILCIKCGEDGWWWWESF